MTEDTSIKELHNITYITYINQINLTSVIEISGVQIEIHILFVQQYQTHRRSICISPLVLDSHSRVIFWCHCSLFTSCVSMIQTYLNPSLPSNLVTCRNKMHQ